VAAGPFIATPLEIPVPVAIDPPPAPAAIEPPPSPAVTVAVEPPSAPAPAVTSSVLPAPAVTSPVPSAPAVTSAAAAPPPVLKRRRGGLAERMVRAAQAARSAAMETQSATPLPSVPATPASPAAPPVPPAALPVPAAATTPAPAPNRATPARPAPTEELQRRLLDAGLSRTRAHELIGAALEITEDDELLTHAVRHELISALPAPTPLPSGGGVIAVVGAGGSGKTRCVTALAVACARAGSRPVSVARLGTPARATELAELVAGENISVIPAMRTRATVRAVSSAGERGLVILDTPAASPGGPSAVEVLGDALAQFELDAIYLAVPATITARAAARLTEGFAPLGLDGLIATHVDEADQLGVVAELSMQTELPISHTHAGVDVTTALKPMDPDRLAEVLFP
jgi:flagellar biosynthesis protein FlhF